MKFLIITNNATPDLAGFKAWFESKTPFTFEPTTIQVSIPNVYKTFGTFGTLELFGLDGIKEKLRPSVPMNTYDVVMYFYDSKDATSRLAYWTYPTQINGAVFIEIPVRPEWDYYLTTALTHEICHGLRRLLEWKGTYVLDDMDLYDKNDDINATDGNRARNLARMAPYFKQLMPKTIIDKVMDVIVGPKFDPIVGIPRHLARVALWELTDIEALHPLVKERCKNLIAKMAQFGKPVRLVEGLRTAKKQDELFNKVPKVTNAKGLQSYHQYGLAFDLVFRSSGYNAPQADWELLGREGKKLGLEWGGSWVGFKDQPHFEYHPNFTWKELETILK